MDGPFHIPEALCCASHQIFGNLLKYSRRQCAYLFPCRKEVKSTKKQSNDAGNLPSLFPLHYLYLSMSLICWASSCPCLSSPFELGSGHSFPWNSEVADSVPQDIAFRHLPLALPLMALAHRVRWYQLLWEAFFILHLLHLTPLSATVCTPCHGLRLSLSSEMDLRQADSSPLHIGSITLCAITLRDFWSFRWNQNNEAIQLEVPVVLWWLVITVNLRESRIPGEGV